MAATLLSSLILGSFRSSNRLLIRINPRNPTRRISFSATADPQLPPNNLCSTQRCRISFGSRSPFLQHASAKIETLIKSGQRGAEIETLIKSGQRGAEIETLIKAMEPQETSIHKSQMEEKKKKLLSKRSSPSLVLGVTGRVDHKDRSSEILFISTFDSNGALLKRFSKPMSKPFVLSACENLILVKDQHDSFLCNFVTQKTITIPRYYHGPYQPVGFGYVPSTKKFKLLAFRQNKFMILTLGKSSRWRRVEIPPADIKEIQKDGGAPFVNGAIHLRVGLGDRIVTFNIQREEWGLIVPPPLCPNTSRSLKELSGRLCIADKRFINSIDIWLLDHHGSWVTLGTINLSVFPDEPIFQVEPLAIEKDGRILLLLRSLNRFSLEFYDLKTKSIQEFRRFQKPYDGYKDLSVSFFVPGASVRDSIQFCT